MRGAAATNIEMLSRVARRLGHLRERVVFLGGATVSLLITDPAAPAVRATKDVDVIVEVTSTIDYAVGLRSELLALGFHEDTSEGAPLCRWIADETLVDVMPTDPTVLGFSNRWYPTAIATAREHGLPGGPVIRLVTPACFVATKFEAFAGRGAGDYAASHDIEDLVALVDGRPELLGEVASANDGLRGYVSGAVSELLLQEPFLDALAGHLPPDEASQARVPLLLQRLRSLATL